MDADVAQDRDRLRRMSTQFPTDLALRIDSVERRLAGIEGALTRLGGSGSSGPLQAAPSSALARPAVHGYGSTMPGFGEHRRHVHVPSTAHTVPMPAPALAIPTYIQTSSNSSIQHSYQQQPPRSAAHPSPRIGSGQNAAFLPFALEKIEWASQNKSRSDNRTW